MKTLKHTILASLIGGLFMVTGLAQAQTVAEVETNNPIPSAQPLQFGSGSNNITVNGVLGTMSGAPQDDLDFYSFAANAGDVLTINLDATGYNPNIGEFDTGLGLYLVTATGYTLVESNDDAGIDARTPDLTDPPCPGGASATDSQICQFPVETTGTYVVMVTDFSRKPQPEGGVLQQVPGFFENGSYTLSIARAAAPVVDSSPVVTQDPPPVEDPPPVVVVSDPPPVTDTVVVTNDPPPVTDRQPVARGHRHHHARGHHYGWDKNRDLKKAKRDWAHRIAAERKRNRDADKRRRHNRD